MIQINTIVFLKSEINGLRTCEEETAMRKFFELGETVLKKSRIPLVLALSFFVVSAGHRAITDDQGAT